MRPEAILTIKPDALRHFVGYFLACTCLLHSGCQLTRPVSEQGPNVSIPRSINLKPPQTETSPTQPATENGNRASAIIRGQSPAPQTSQQWNAATAGNGDSFRSPMPPTDTTMNRFLLPPGQPTNLPPAPNQQASAPLVNYQSGATQPVSPSYGLPAPQSPNQPSNAFQPQVPAPGYGNPAYGYGAPGTYPAESPSDYGSAIAPGATQSPGSNGSSLAPGVMPYYDPTSGITVPPIANSVRERIAPIDVYVQEARTGRIILGGSVNSDLGVAGQLIIDERNFDIRRFPSSWSELWAGRAFRGGGQNFRAEIMPGSRVERYTLNWTQRNLFGYLPYSLSVGGFLYTRQFRDWTEQRLGGRMALGYEITKDLSISSELRLEDVKIFDPRISGVNQLDSALGSNDLYTARFRIAHDTRDSPFMSSEGALLELIFDQVFGEYDYSRGAVNYSRYFNMRERADGTGRHTLASTWRFGVTGSQTPIFENYFAGGYSTMRGFSFRGASPKVGDVQVGGEFMFLGSLEYVFPLTADEMLRGVAFVDYGTIEQDIEVKSENFRVAPGLGLRITVPALGPAPLAFDFAYPINYADTDDRQVFSFFMGFTR